MKGKVKYLVILLLLCCFSYGHTQITGPEYLITVLKLYDFTISVPLRDLDFLGGGARARGMGGAFLALSDDASAASWNPAGLVQMNKIQTSFSLLTSNWDIKYDNSLYPRYPSQLFTSGTDFSSEKTLSTINYASFLIPFKLYSRDFVGSVVFNQAASLRDNYVIPVDSAGNSYRNDLSGRLNYVGLAAAGKLFSGVSLGATVNIYAGSFTNNKYQTFAPYGTPPDDTTITARPYNKATYAGANVTLGLMYQKNKLRLAATAKTPLTLEETDDVSWLFDFTVRGVTNPLPVGQIGFLYKTVRKWKIPLSWGLGTSYSVSEKLLLAADLETRSPGKVKLQYQVNPLDPVSPFVEINIKDLSAMDISDNTYQIRLGAEYMIPTALSGKLFLRGGYRNQPKVRNTAFEVRGDSADARNLFQGNFTQLTTNWLLRDGSLSGNVYTLGIGWARAQIKLDVGIEFNRLKLENSGILYLDPLNNPSNTISFSEKNDYNLTRYMFNFTGYF